MPTSPLDLDTILETVLNDADFIASADPDRESLSALADALDVAQELAAAILALDEEVRATLRLPAAWSH